MAENKNTNSYEIDKDNDRGPSGGSTRYTTSSADIELLRVSGVSEDDITLSRYLNYHREIQGLLHH